MFEVTEVNESNVVNKFNEVIDVNEVTSGAPNKPTEIIVNSENL